MSEPAPPEPGPPTRDSVFTARLHDGTTRHFDAMAVRNKLTAALPDWGDRVSETIKTTQPAPPGTPLEFLTKRADRQASLVESLSAAATHAFGLPPLAEDGTGYTMGERLAVIGQYMAYTTAAVEDVRPLVFGDAPTAAGSPTPSAVPSPPANGSP